VVTNDRWGAGLKCKHGGYFSCDDHFNPGKLFPHKWENAMTVDKGSWGFRRIATADDYRTPQDIISELVSTVSCGGNLLLNVGPTKYGTIAPIMEERLLQLGEWLGINGDAIYSSNPWKVAQNDSIAKSVWYTAKPGDKRIFAIALEDGWPQAEDNDGEIRINLGSVKSNEIAIQSIRLLGYKDGQKDLVWEPCNGSNCKQGILITLPHSRLVCSQWAWTFVINYE
jgi:alpha-L-fucosidase